MSEKELTKNHISKLHYHRNIFPFKSIILLGYFILLSSCSWIASAENFEFQLNSPMLITSLRTFERVGDDLLVAKAREGSVLLTADSGYGIMAVVQTMNLQDINDPTHKTKCHDYIKMSQISGSDETREICGNFESMPALLNSGGNVNRPSFVDKKGAVELSYVLNEKSRVSPINTTITNFNVSFTPFTECPEGTFPFGNEHVRPCSNLDTFSCISLDYFCDGVVNCGFPGEYGLDEMNCPLKPPVFNVPLKDEDQNQNRDEGPLLPEEVLAEPYGHGPYDPYVSQTDDVNEAKVRNITSFDYGHVFVIRSTRLSYKALVGVSAVVICLALYCVTTASSIGGRRPSNRILQRMTIVDIEGPIEIERNVEVDAGLEGKGKLNDGLMSYYDVESDPAPSYDECLLIQPPRCGDQPVYSQLSYEFECPPSYEEIRVHHQIHRKS